MKHVNDEFWQQFGPEVLAVRARPGQVGVLHVRRGRRRDEAVHVALHDDQTGCRACWTSRSRRRRRTSPATRARRSASADFFADDDWYTDADSNVYQLPTFLGNHDDGPHRPRSSTQSQSRAPPTRSCWPATGSATSSCTSRAATRSCTTATSRASPGDGGDQLARQDMFPSRVAEYNDDDLIGTDRDHRGRRTSTARIRSTADRAARARDRDHPALRDGAHAAPLRDGGTGDLRVLAPRREEQREYVVALNNAETAKTASIPTWAENRRFDRVYGSGAGEPPERRARAACACTVPPLSAVVYASSGRIPRSEDAPTRAPRRAVAARRSRAAGWTSHAASTADSFYEVTFQAQGRRRRLDVDRDGRQRALPRLPRRLAGSQTGTAVEYRAIVLDNAGSHAHEPRAQHGGRRRRASRSRRRPPGALVRDQVRLLAQRSIPSARTSRSPSTGASARARGPTSGTDTSVARLHGGRRHLRPRARRGRAGPLPRRADRGRRQRGH